MTDALPRPTAPPRRRRPRAARPAQGPGRLPAHRLPGHRPRRPAADGEQQPAVGDQPHRHLVRGPHLHDRDGRHGRDLLAGVLLRDAGRRHRPRRETSSRRYEGPAGWRQVTRPGWDWWGAAATLPLSPSSLVRGALLAPLRLIPRSSASPSSTVAAHAGRARSGGLGAARFFNGISRLRVTVMTTALVGIVNAVLTRC